MNNVVNKLIDLNRTISTMESCTGGYLASTITNVSGSSVVFKFGAVTYSNEYKIKMNVNEEVINKYTVYSIEVANEMSRCISEYADSDYGVGITGKLNSEDIYNKTGDNDLVYVSIYDRLNNEYFTKIITVSNVSREENKKRIIEIIIDILCNIIK